MTTPKDDTVSAIYGSGGGNYLKGDDIPAKEDWELVINGWDKKEFDQSDFETGEKYKKWKVILSFAGEDRKVVLNAGNAKAIQAAYGDDLPAWIGKSIILYQGEWQGKPALRVRTPKVVKKVAPKPIDERNPPPNDDMPF
jgi:hypothetical protein